MRRTFMLPTLVASLALTASSLGQGNPPPGGPGGGSAAPVRAGHDRINVLYEGGTVGGYLRALREADPNANIVVQREDVLALPLGRIELKSVTAMDALMLVNGMRNADETVRLTIQTPPVSNNSAPIAILTATGWMDSTEEIVETPTIQVWSLAEYLAGSPWEPEDVLAAIELVLSESRDGDIPTLRYHKDTMLLIGRVTHDESEMIVMTLNELQRGVVHQRRMVHLNEANSAMQRELEQLQREREAMRRQLASNEQEQRQMMMALETREVRFQEQRDRIERLMLQVAELQAEVTRLRSARPGGGSVGGGGGAGASGSGGSGQDGNQ